MVHLYIFSSRGFGDYYSYILLESIRTIMVSGQPKESWCFVRMLIKKAGESECLQNSKYE